MTSKCIKIALVQMAVGKNKMENLNKAIQYIQEAKEKGSDIVVLPECFNSPYGTKYFDEYAENIPDGKTSLLLSEAAKSSQITIIGGSIPERNGEKIFNTCSVWNTEGNLITKYSKMHLFDIDIKGGQKFKESDTLTGGNKFVTFDVAGWRVGLGICYDLRFPELSRIYALKGCDLLVYPGAFNMTTGPMHWDLLIRSRAIDSQAYVAAVAPARDTSSDYHSWGHSCLVDPWGKILQQAEADPQVIIQEINKEVVSTFRDQVPILKQRRTDLYNITELN